MNSAPAEHSLHASLGVIENVSLGVRLDVGGEKLFVADDQGNTVSDPVMCAAMAALVFRTYPGSTVVVTADQPLLYERLAEIYGGHVRRCPADPQALMQAAADDGITWQAMAPANSSFLRCIRPLTVFLPSANCSRCWPANKCVCRMSSPGCRRSTWPAGKVDGMWETKGRIMRCLIQQFTKLHVETLDGIKIYLNDTEWVLIKPDNDTATFHLVAEARSPQAAQEIIADYGGIVHRYVQTPCSDEIAPETWHRPIERYLKTIQRVQQAAWPLAEPFCLHFSMNEDFIVMSITFGTDGWRAVISDEFTFANVRRVAQAIAEVLLENAATACERAALQRPHWPSSGSTHAFYPTAMPGQ